MDSRLKFFPPEMLSIMGLNMKPCRFCGAAAHVSDNIFQDENGRYSAFCMECGNTTDEHDDPREAVVQWNDGAMIDAGL